MSDPLLYLFLGYVAGVALGLLAGLDLVVRAGKAGAVVTSRWEAARWLLGTPEEEEE